MKISRNWLQDYFEAPLPDASALAEALTFHAFEIESLDKVRHPMSNVEEDILDVKITPNRGHDGLCHRGIAKELSATLDIPMEEDPLRLRLNLNPMTDAVKVVVEDSTLCPRFTGALIRGVKVGKSPEWLRERLEAVGQKSINNIVDATNFVMFDIGQPLHAFDAGKLKQESGKMKLDVRNAKKGEKVVGLDDKEYVLSESMLVIADGNAGTIASIAGIKGGKPSGIDGTTTEIFLEAANWHGATIRKASQALKLRTDASERFQQVISPDLAAYGTLAAAKLITELAGGEVLGFVDEYPKPQKPARISVSVAKVNAVLGTSLAEKDVADAFARLGLPHEKKDGTFTVAPPFERLDLTIPEDLIEEVARIIGYDKVPAVELSPLKDAPAINKNFYAAEKIREELVGRGYSEVFTSVFTEKGAREVLNKVGGERSKLRDSLMDGLTSALVKNVQYKDLLGLKEVKLFEIGSIWSKKEERVDIATVGENEPGHERELQPIKKDSYDDLPTSTLERYQSFSKYPFIVRDIALWVPADTNAEDVLSVIRAQAGELLIRGEKFDEFKKGEKISFAFRLVFQSFDRTLTDEDANSRMESVYTAVKGKGWEVR